jgi:hypothetical protein
MGGEVVSYHRLLQTLASVAMQASSLSDVDERNSEFAKRHGTRAILGAYNHDNRNKAKAARKARRKNRR